MKKVFTNYPSLFKEANETSLGFKTAGDISHVYVKQATRNLADAQLLIQTAETGIRQSDENLRIMNQRFALSLSPLTDIPDAQSQWQQAESNLIEDKTQYKISEAEYLRALGILE